MSAMKHYVLLLSFFALTEYVRGKCDDGGARAQECMSGLIHVVKIEENDKELCPKLIETRDCFLDLANSCLTGNQRANLQDAIDVMTERVDSQCNLVKAEYEDDVELTEEEMEMVQCAKDFAENLELLAEPCTHYKGRFDGYQIQNVHDLKCVLYLSHAECVLKKVVDQCGEFVKGPIFAGMLQALEENDPETARSPPCVQTIAELNGEEDNKLKRKRRALKSFNFNDFI